MWLITKLHHPEYLNLAVRKIYLADDNYRDRARVTLCIRERYLYHASANAGTFRAFYIRANTSRQ